jgi:hypothetical protein
MVGQTFFGPDGGVGLSFGADIHVEPAFIPVRNSVSQLGNAFGGGVAVVSALLGCLHELCHDMGRGSLIGITHPQINDVFSPATGFHLQGVDRGKNIRGQPLHTREFFHRHNLSPLT